MVLLSFRGFETSINLVFTSICIRMTLIEMLLCLCMSFALML